MMEFDCFMERVWDAPEGSSLWENCEPIKFYVTYFFLLMFQIKRNLCYRFRRMSSEISIG